MCGIAGIITPKPVSDINLDRMSDALVHRGPDDKGLWQHENVSLIHRRLSIIDIDNGHQPMLSADGNLAIFFNGEINNHPELRDKLVAKGRHFLTHYDTEVLLHMYAEYGADSISKLRGMFAFYAIYRHRKIVMCTFILLTIFETIMPVVWSWLVAFAIDIDQIDLIYYLAFVPLTLLLIRLPISLDGFGINEGAYVYFLSLVGISAASGFAIGLITHIVFLACLTPGILLYLFSNKKFRPITDNTVAPDSAP
jgi:hypothetical protein